MPAAVAGDDNLPALGDLPVIDAPTLDDIPALPDAGKLETFRQIATRLDPRLRRPMSRWRLIVSLLRDPHGATVDLAERLSALPTIARQHRLADDPAERAHRREARARAAQTVRAKKQAKGDE